ncbi:YceI family protein [Sulfurimonas sp. HSL3-7]|uniref:YceI family protein n=1 Tax=Sulfonitrofixus jiaomeiensis TaxID=3131938 RepID=UPI0031F95333
MKMITVIAISSLLTAASLFGADFSVDKAHTNIGFKVRHMMVSNTQGSFDDFSGSFSYDPKTRQLTALEGKVTVASVNTDEAKRDDHLRSPDFFDAEKYPAMTMKFVKQEGDKVTVALTIKDVTKNVVLEMDDASDAIKDPWGNTRVGFSLEGKINRQEFNITFSKLMETGGLVVGDDVKLQLEIEGIQAK